MKLYYKKRNGSVDATIEWNQKDNTFTVLKGSIVSPTISTNTKFRSAKSVEKARSNGTVVDCKLTIDITFNSASTASNFINGSSSNGLLALKDINGRPLKTILLEKTKNK